MTHNYINQIRTIPNYHEDHSDIAKTLRKVSYATKSATNFIIKNKKTRVITSVLAVYMVITSGFVASFVNINNNEAKAGAYEPSKDVGIVVKDIRSNGQKINLDVEITNSSKLNLSKPFIQIKNTNNKINWIEVINVKNNQKNKYQSGTALEDLSAGQKSTYRFSGELTDPTVKNVALMVEGFYSVNSNKVEIASPRSFVSF
jgi:hypothetical protein